MTYYLSGALASQNSASINQAITGGLPLSVNDFGSSIKENLAFDLSPSGEYMLKTTFMGTGSFESDPGNDYDPGMIIYQSGSSNGFERAAFIKIKGSRANDSAYFYADANNLYSPRFLSDDTIVIACDSYDPQDGGTTLADGVFIVVTGSGTSWGISQIFSGSTSHSVASTAQSRNANLGGPGVIADFAGNDDHAKMIAANNKYSSTLATRVAVHNYGGHSSGGRPQGMITIFQQSGGTWSFHSQFSQEDMSAYVQGSFSSAITVHDMTWIDENNLVVVYFADGSTDYSYMMAMTWNASTSKWEVSGYSGSEMTNYTYRLTTRLSLDASTSGVQGIRFVEYDPFSERLLMGYQGDSIWMFQSQSNWLRDDLYGSGFGKGNTSEEEDHGHSGVLGFPPFGHKQHMRFAFGDGRTTIIGVQSRYGSEQSAANSAYNSLVYHESSSAGWMNYDISYANSTYQGRLRHEYFSTGSVSALAAEPTTGFGITPWIHSRQAAEYYGAKTAFTMNSTNGGDGNTFVYHEADEASILGSSQKDNQRLLVGNFGAFPASNPALAASVTSSIGTSGGTLKAGGTESSPAIQVTVPANALSGDTSLSAEVVSDATYKGNNLSSIKKQAGSAGAELVGDIFRMTPHGQNFSSAVTVQLELASAPADLQIWKRDSHEGNYTQWYRLPDHLWSNSGTTVTINTTRFSEFAGLGGINVARTKLNNSQLVTLTSTDLVDSTSIRISGSNTGKNLTVAAGDLFILESSGATYHVSASQMAEYFGGLVSVSASSDDSDMRMTFVSPDDSTDVGLAVDAGILYNPNSNTLKGTNLSGSGTLQIAGNTDLAGTLDVVGLISGSGGLDIAGAADFGAAVNIQGALDVDGATTLDGLTVAEAAVFSSTISATGLISGSGGLDIGGSADFGAAVNVQGALDVDGATTLDGLTVAEAAVFSSTISATGLISGSGGLDIGGSADFGAAVNVQGALDVDGATTLDALTVAEAAVFQSTISGSGNISGGGDLRLDGAAELRSTLSVEGNADLNGQLDVAGATSLAASGVLTDIRGTLSVDEAATFDSSVTIAGNLTVQGTTTSVDSQNTLLEDPLMVLGSSSNGVSADGDRGLILELSGSNNKAMFWDNSASEFAFVDTTSNHDATVVATTDYADLHIGALSADDASSFGGDVTVTGDVSASANLYAAGAVTASFFSGDGSGLTGVGAEVLAASSDSIDLQLAFTSGTAAAAQFFIDSGSITYNPGTDTLKSVNMSASGNISAAGALNIDGAADLRSSLNVAGLISGSAGMDLAGTADFGGAVNIQGALDVDGATTLDGLTVAEAAVFSSTISATGLISGSGGLDIGGSADFGAAVNVQGALDVDGATTLDGLTVAEAAVFSSTVSATGLISGSGGIDIAGAADFGAAVNVQGALDVDGATTLDALTVAEAATFEGAVNLGDSGADAIVVSGALDVGSQNTKFRSNQVEFLNLDSMAVDSNDATHFLLVQDSDNNYIKKESVTDFVQHITGAAGTRGGIQVHQGKLHIVQAEESFLSSSMTAGLTASIAGPVLSGSLMVFLNGLLQTRSGSANSISVFDYKVDSETAPTEIRMADSIDSDDVLIVRYIQK